MWLLCWLYGHNWFPTVRTHATYIDYGEDFGEDTYVLGEFEEKLCLRCHSERAFFLQRLASHCPYWNEPYWNPEEEDPPEWLHQPPQHYALPGDWSI